MSSSTECAQDVITCPGYAEKVARDPNNNCGCPPVPLSSSSTTNCSQDLITCPGYPDPVPRDPNNNCDCPLAPNIFCIYEEDYNPSIHKIIETHESMNECKQNCVCTDCSFEDISNLENYTANGSTVVLFDYFDATQSMRAYSPQAKH